jgi:breast cancer 2 susceptibility protein
MKLGYYFNPVISSLGSLTADGGCVAMVDITVVKTFPIAYIEFVEEPDGTQRREGPRTEKDERQMDERWKARRMNAVEQLKDKMEETIQKWQQCARRLERKAGPRVLNEAEGQYS